MDILNQILESYPKPKKHLFVSCNASVCCVLCVVCCVLCAVCCVVCCVADCAGVFFFPHLRVLVAAGIACFLLPAVSERHWD